MQIPVVNNTWHYEQQLVCLHIALYPWQLVVNMQFVLTYYKFICMHDYWKLWWLLVSYLIWHLTTQTVNKSKTKIWPNPLPGWSTFDHIPDHIFLIIHFVCRHFLWSRFYYPNFKKKSLFFSKAITFHISLFLFQYLHA